MTSKCIAGTEISDDFVQAKTKKIYFFAVKVPNVGISPGFWLIKEKKDVPNIQAHTLKD